MRRTSSSPRRAQIDVSALIERFPNVVWCGLFQGLRLAGLRIVTAGVPSWLGHCVQQLPFGIALTSLPAVAACYDAEDQLQQRIS